MSSGGRIGVWVTLLGMLAGSAAPLAQAQAPRKLTKVTLAQPYSLTGAVVAEMFAPNRGLG